MRAKADRLENWKQLQELAGPAFQFRFIESTAEGLKIDVHRYSFREKSGEFYQE